MMNDSSKELEAMIVETSWDDKDTDIVVQYKIDQKLGLKNKPDINH